MKTVAMALMIVAMALPCQAKGQYVVGALGGTDGVGSFFGYRPNPAGAVEVGVAGYRTDAPIWCAAAYATYDVAKDVNIPWKVEGIGSGNIKASAFVGGEVGNSWARTATGYDSTGLTALLTGIYFGEGPVRIGLIGRVPVGGPQWNGDLNKAALLAISYAF